MSTGSINGSHPPLVDGSHNNPEAAKETDGDEEVVKPQTASGTRPAKKGLNRFKVSQSKTDKGLSISNPPPSEGGESENSDANS